MASKASAGADGHEGSRWINRRPESKEVADWFVQNAPIAEGLKAERYVTGVTLIPAKEKPKVIRNNTVMDGAEQLVYTPYVKVDTRIAYFWDLMALHREDWVGAIEAEPMAQMRGEGLTNEHLPAGAFRMPVKRADGKVVDFVGFSYQVTVFDRSTVEKVRVVNPGSPPGWKRDAREDYRIVGVPVMRAPAGSKVVPTLNKYGEDPFALMKAQTGAMGRALGMAGMLVIPGSGVATAEDVQEAQQQGAAGAIEPTLEGDVARGLSQPEDLLAHANVLIARLQSDYPDAFAKVASWAEQRKMRMSEMTPQSPALRGVVKKLEDALREAEAAG